MKTISRMLFCFVLLNVSLFRIAFSQNQNISTYLPNARELKGWNQEDSARMFVGEDLFMLIDGGADIYFEYGFRQVAAAEYKKSHENSIKLEIYEMSDASAAYGMFSLNAGTQGKKVQIGNEGMLFDYYLIFWKNTFLVFLTGADTAGETISGILSMAACIDQRLGAPGTKPALTSYLPNSGLQSCTFVRGMIGLSSFYTFDTKNIFGMKEGVIGSYPTYTLFIFHYNSDKEAEERYKKAKEVQRTSSRFSSFKEYAGRYTMIDQKGTQLCVTYSKNLLVIILSKQKNDVIAISEDVMRSLHHDRDPKY